MTLPCWIKHDWGKWQEPEIEVSKRTESIRGRMINQYHYAKWIQMRVCGKCGRIDWIVAKEGKLTERAANVFMSGEEVT